MAGVYVLGMHRSGTSATTRLVDLLGVPVAREGLLAPDDRNPVGFWEPERLIDANDRLLAALGGSWLAPPPLDVLATAGDRLAGELEPAREEFRTAHPGPTWVWKDPRTCLTLGFWRRALDEGSAAVVAYRQPLAVAYSMWKHLGVAPGLTLPLWERYLRAAVTLTAGLPSLVVDYDRLVAEPLAVAQAVAAFLAEHGLVRPGGAAIADAAASIAPDLARSRPRDWLVALSPEQRELADGLAEAARAGSGLEGIALGKETSTTAGWLAIAGRWGATGASG